MPIFGKNLLLQNRKAEDLETGHAASALKYYQVCPNDDLFYGKVKFAPLCFRMEKR